MDKSKVGDMLGGGVIFHSKTGTIEPGEHTPCNSPKSFMKGTPVAVDCW